MTETPPGLTPQHKPMLLLGGVALIVLGIMALFSYADILQWTEAVGSGLDPRLYFAACGVMLIALGVVLLVSALRIKAR